MEPNNPQGIYFYAELLPNIRQMVLTVSLPSEATDSTRVQVAQDRSHVSVLHQGVTAEALLPGLPLVSGVLSRGSNASAKDLVWRLPLDASSCAREAAAELNAPWSADKLQPRTAVRCRSCEAGLVAEGKISEWKDLPSENWAEMMEFWHCHKPDHHGHDHSNGLASRGYGADSMFTAQQGVGFVDIMTVLLSQDDCQGITISHGSKSDGEAAVAVDDGAAEIVNGGRPPMANVACSSCKSRLGYLSFRTAAVTLFKWQVICTASSPPTLPTISNCLVPALAAASSQSGSAKSFLLPLDGDDNTTDMVLYVWVLNRRVRFTSTGVAGRVPAMKVMWRVVTAREAEKVLEPVLAREQEVNLPGGAIGAVFEELERSNRMYPAKDRVYQDWKVGLLRCWEESP